MGMIELVKVASAVSKTLHGAPGSAVIVTASGIGGRAIEAEVYNPAGLLSVPPKDARGIFIPFTGRNGGVVLSGHNYKVSISLADGETAIFSTTADGATLKAQVVLGTDGKIKLINETKSLKTILTTLIQHVRDLVTINCAVGAPVTLNPATIADLNADVTELAALLKD